MNCYWVSPPPESRPLEVARPMSMQHNVVVDPSIEEDVISNIVSGWIGQWRNIVCLFLTKISGIVHQVLQRLAGSDLFQRNLERRCYHPRQVKSIAYFQVAQRERHRRRGLARRTINGQVQGASHEENQNGSLTGTGKRSSG